jgi:hypothetical protein
MTAWHPPSPWVRGARGTDEINSHGRSVVPIIPDALCTTSTKAEAEHSGC